MPTQSIDLSSTGTTACTFNSSTVEKINLNGTEIWTKPSSGGGTYTRVSTIPAVTIQAYEAVRDQANTSNYYLMHLSTGKLYNSSYNSGGTTCAGYYTCGYYCGVFSNCLYGLGSEVTTNKPSVLISPFVTTIIYNLG